ncbi:MAG: hypothetical protein V4685_13065 [Bacteroidota bacterium]
MKELTLQVDEKKYKFFLDLIRNFDFVSVQKEPSKKELLLSVAKGMHQASQASQGKMKSRNAKSFLNEL